MGVVDGQLYKIRNRADLGGGGGSCRMNEPLAQAEPRLLERTLKHAIERDDVEELLQILQALNATAPSTAQRYSSDAPEPDPEDPTAGCAEVLSSFCALLGSSVEYPFWTSEFSAALAVCRATC